MAMAIQNVFARDVRAERRVVARTNATPRTQDERAREDDERRVARRGRWRPRRARRRRRRRPTRDTRASSRRRTRVFFSPRGPFRHRWRRRPRWRRATRKSVARGARRLFSRRRGGTRRGTRARERGVRAIVSRRDATREASRSRDGARPRGGVRHLAPRHHGSLHQTPRAHLRRTRASPRRRAPARVRVSSVMTRRNLASKSAAARDGAFSPSGLARATPTRSRARASPTPRTRSNAPRTRGGVLHTFGGDGEPTPTLGVARNAASAESPHAGLEPREPGAGAGARGESRTASVNANHGRITLRIAAHRPERVPRVPTPRRARPRDAATRDACRNRRDVTRRYIRPSRSSPRDRAAAPAARAHASTGPRRRARRSRRDTHLRTATRRSDAPLRGPLPPTPTWLARVGLKSDDAEDVDASPWRRRCARALSARAHARLAPSGDERARETGRVVFESL